MRGSSRGEPGVDLTQHDARLHPHAFARVEHLDPGETSPHVHQEMPGHSLPAQAGPAGAEGQRHPVGGAEPHQRTDLVGALRYQHGLWGQQVVGRVVGQAQPIGDPRPRYARCGHLQCRQQGRVGWSQRHGYLLGFTQIYVPGLRRHVGAAVDEQVGALDWWGRIRIPSGGVSGVAAAWPSYGSYHHSGVTRSPPGSSSACRTRPGSVSPPC